jgi:hypothetical protein
MIYLKMSGTGNLFVRKSQTCTTVSCIGLYPNNCSVIISYETGFSDTPKAETPPSTHDTSSNEGMHDDDDHDGDSPSAIYTEE